MPLHSPGPEASGLILLSYSRALLPQLGTAEIIFRYGRFGSRMIGASADSSFNLSQGDQWDPQSDTLDLPDFAGKEIRIQAAPRPSDPTDTPEWATVWWGSCEYQTDEGWGAAAIPSGQRTYHCIEGLHRLKRWPLDTHGFSGGGVTIANAKGHPGYNVGSNNNARANGNREATGATYTTKAGSTAFYHCHPSAGTTWTDEQVVEHVLASARPLGEPLWSMTGATDLFDSTGVWEVNQGDTAFDLIARICDRSRGRGAVRTEWTESSPTGPLSITLKAYAQIVDDITYNAPTGTSVSIYGASNNGTLAGGTGVVDLIGDHRFVAGSLVLGEAEQYQVDYLESEGEQIEVLATLSYEDDTLEKGWTDAQATAFRALDPEKRTENKWKEVYQLHRLKRGFVCTVGDGNGTGGTHCDYRCTDAGAIVLPAVNDTSPISIEIMDDLPIYAGYNYATTPVRYDSQSAATFDGEPLREEIRWMIRDDDEQFYYLKEFESGFQVHKGPDGFWVLEGNDQSAGTRYFADTTDGDTNSQQYYTKLVFTVGLRLPHRVRMATGQPDKPRRKKITHPGLHLWMAHQGAIWDLDTSDRDGASGVAPKRAASASTTPPGILRDDRDQLARLHATAVAWYGPLFDLLGEQVEGPARRGASWSLKCCGDIPTSADYDGGGVVYAKPGECITYLQCNGQRIRLYSPVSSFVYDNTNGTTTWTVDWQDLDFAK